MGISIGHRIFLGNINRRKSLIVEGNTCGLRKDDCIEFICGHI